MEGGRDEFGRLRAGELRGEAWSGNIGARYVDIDQEINSYQAVSSAANADVSSLFGNWIYQDTNNKHSKVLPSANLKFSMAEDVVFRFAASQTMTLPDYSALGASSWGSDLNRTGGGGNPDLKPVMSTNFDGNLEWYFMPRGLLSLGAFSMDWMTTSPLVPRHGCCIAS
jgi:iron complex outermembrane receptor protein